MLSWRILRSQIHGRWSSGECGLLGVYGGRRYIKSRCFDPFPFPDPPEALRAKLRVAGEELDSFRKQRQAEHPIITLTQMYNVLEKLKAMGGDGLVLPLSPPPTSPP